MLDGNARVRKPQRILDAKEEGSLELNERKGKECACGDCLRTTADGHTLASDEMRKENGG